METQANLIESFWEKAEAYGKTTLELYKLKALEAAIVISTTLITRLVIVVMVSMFALILNIGIALLIGDLLGKLYYGFFIVSAFYLVATVVFSSFLHQWIKKPLTNTIINQALQSAP